MSSPPLPSTSAISATTTTWVHVIKLRGYSHAKRLLDTGERVTSAVFQAAGHSWQVHVYPNGGNAECRPGSIALYLELVGNSKGDVVTAELRFSLLRHGAKLVSLSSAHDGGRRTDAPVTFNADVAGWGIEDVGTHGELHKPEYLEDDTILIRCDITVPDLVVERRHLPELGLLHSGSSSKKKKASQIHSMAQPPAPSASTIAVTASTGCHVVKFSGYSLLPGNGKHIKSAEFKEAGHAWRVWCSPDGDSEETAGHVSLYLELAGVEATDVHAEFEFSLVPHGHLAPCGDATCGARATYDKEERCFGIEDFKAREELEESEYLKDDCFYIRCDIAAMNKPVAKLLHGAEALGLLCCCDDHELCKNIHGRRDKVEADACLGMLLSCLPIRSKPSRRTVFGVEYSRL
nr:unnamed protein product [Digitaria exilis]